MPTLFQNGASDSAKERDGKGGVSLLVHWITFSISFLFNFYIIAGEQKQKMRTAKKTEKTSNKEEQSRKQLIVRQ